MIAGTVQGGAAAGAGIVAGDVITSVGGQAVTSANGLRDTLTAHHPGDSVKVTWQNQEARPSRPAWSSAAARRPSGKPGAGPDGPAPA